MNFNDQGASIVTLFHISIVNNWYVTVNMFRQALGSNWPVLYFVIWWAVSVLVLQNLIIAFVMEIYGQTTEQVEQEFKRRAALQKISAQFRAGESLDSDALSELKIDCGQASSINKAQEENLEKLSEQEAMIDKARESLIMLQSRLIDEQSPIKQEIAQIIECLK